MNIEELKAAALGAIGVKRRGTNREVPPALGNYSVFSDFPKWDMDKALKDGYAINEWVFACVNAYAHHAASVPWRVSEFTGAEQKGLFLAEYESLKPSERNDFLREAHRKQVRYRWGAENKAHLAHSPDDPLEKLLAKPNGHTPRHEFVERAVQHMMLGGNAMWLKVRSKVLGVPGYKTPFQLWPLFPQAVEVKADGQVPTSYLYAPEGKGVNPRTEKEYDPLDVIHFRFTDPRDPIWGMAPLTAAARAVDTDVEFSKWNFNAAKNRFVPDAVLAYKDNLKPEQHERAERRFDEHYKGRARGPFISGNPVEVHQLSLSPVEMDFIKSRGLNRQSICSIFRVFAPVIAVLEGIPVGNMDAILKHHWIQTMIPFLDRLQGTINLSLTPEFGENRFAWYDTNNVEALTDTYVERTRWAKVYHTMGFPATHLNERFDLGFDLDDVPLADEPIFGAGVTTATMILNGMTGSGANPNTNPEGGNPGEPGEGQDPTEAPPEDVVPDDPGNNPDTQLSMMALSNGNSDPHGGVKRWTYEQAHDWLTEHSIQWQENVEFKSDDHYEFLLKGDPGLRVADLIDSIAKGGGVEIENGAVRFYHGHKTQRLREHMLEKAREWGYAT